MPSADTPAGDDTATPAAPFIPPPPFPWRAAVRSAVFAALLALCFDLALAFTQVHLLTALHIDPQPFQRHEEFNALFAFDALISAPLLETLIMAAGIGLLRKASRSRAFVIAASGVLWGTVHATYGLLELLPVGIGFAILTALYLRWRPHSFAAAYWSAAWAHALYNAFLVALALLFNKQ